MDIIMRERLHLRAGGREAACECWRLHMAIFESGEFWSFKVGWSVSVPIIKKDLSSRLAIGLEEVREMKS